MQVGKKTTTGICKLNTIYISMEVNLKKGNRVYLLYILSMVIDHSKGLPPSLQIAHASCSNTDKLPGAWEGVVSRQNFGSPT